MNTKLIFLDLDGTLLNDKKEVPKANREAIDAALAMGHKVLVCTGRPLCSALKQLPVLGLDKQGCYAITYNGALIYDAGEKKVIYKKTLSLEMVEYLFAKAKEYGKIHAQTYDDLGFLCEYDTPEGRDYESRTKTDMYLVQNVLEALNGQEPCKILMMAHGFERKVLEGFRAYVEEWAKGKLDVFYSCYEYLEFAPAGINKGNSIQWMSEYLNIPMEHTIAVGDAENDITMIQTAAIGAVMKNAGDDIKQHGNYITELDNNEGGVAEVIRKFMLEA